MRQLLASLAIITAFAVSACGGSDAEVKPAPDRSGGISALEKKVKDLERDIADEEAARRKAAKKEAEATGVGGAPEIDALLAQLPGQSGLVVGAPGGDGPKLSGGSLSTGSAWSTIKVRWSSSSATRVRSPGPQVPRPESRGPTSG